MKIIQEGKQVILPIRNQNAPVKPIKKKKKKKKVKEKRKKSTILI
jgi:hypothetical protein